MMSGDDAQEHTSHRCDSPTLTSPGLFYLPTNEDTGITAPGEGQTILCLQPVVHPDSGNL